LTKQRFRVVYEVHAIISTKDLSQAKKKASELAERNCWIADEVMEDDPEEDDLYNYPKAVKDLIKEERERLSHSLSEEEEEKAP